MFIDFAQIYLKAGNGGNGCCSFRREKFVPRGGPDGGDGGKGGDIVFRGTTSLNTLFKFRHQKHFKAERGQHGMGKNRQGKSGETVYIDVPLGTVIYEIPGFHHPEDTKKFLCDITEEGQEFLVAEGGHGGRGNTRFTSSTNRAPHYCEQGRPGQERYCELELKLLADVGLVGFPNAGKSTLLSKVSAARPKIAGYPFTTLAPNLGVVSLDADHHFVMADIPGLIAGAHEGKGLGTLFLRHIQRTRILLFLLDITSISPAQDYAKLRQELEEYDPELNQKIHICVLNKADLIDFDDEIINEYRKELLAIEPQLTVNVISALQAHGLRKTLFDIYTLLQNGKLL